MNCTIENVRQYLIDHYGVVVPKLTMILKKHITAISLGITNAKTAESVAIQIAQEEKLNERH